MKGKLAGRDIPAVVNPPPPGLGRRPQGSRDRKIGEDEEVDVRFLF